MSAGTASGAPRERLVERALALIVEDALTPRTAGPDPSGALRQWRNRSPEHAAALVEARRRWDALGGMADGLRTHFEMPATQLATATPTPTPIPTPTSTRGPQRRKLLLSVAGLLGTGLVAGHGWQQYRQRPVFNAAYGTRTAQTMKLTLTDAARSDEATDTARGSRLDLAPQSAIHVTLYRQRRVVELARGEVRFDVAHDAERPFQVQTRGAVIEVVGTVFTVRDRGGAITVGVEQGQVRVRVGAAPGHAPPEAEVIDLRPGEMLEVQDGRALAVRRTDTRALSAWRDGWLVFDNTPLGDALASINSYRSRPIVSNDARIDDLRLSGRFRSNDSAGLVALLPTILPVKAVPRPDGSVTLQAR